VDAGGVGHRGSGLNVATPSPLRSSPRLDLAIVTGIALAASCLSLDAKSVWLDEATSIQYAVLGMRDLVWNVVYSDPNMSFYYALLNVWASVAGTSETAMRLPSAISAALTAPLVCFLGAKLAGRWTGIVAGVLFALNPFVLEYAQQVRGYTLVTLLVTASTVLFVAELERPSWMTRIAYVITGVLAFYAHFFGALVLVAHFAALVLIRGRSAFSRDSAFVMAGLVLLCLPIVFFAIRVGGAGVTWISRPTLATIGHAFFEFSGSSIVFVVLLGSAAVFGAIARFHDGERAPIVIFLSWLVVPHAIAFAVSQFKPLYQPHYLLVTLPALVLLAASGLTRIRYPVVMATATVATFFVTAKLAVDWHRRGSQEDWRAAAAWIATQVKPGDGILFMPVYVTRAYQYYGTRQTTSAPEILKPPSYAQRERIWLVSSPAHMKVWQKDMDDVRAALSAKHRVAARQSFNQVVIEYYVR
jgi:mannosyltransferase